MQRFYAVAIGRKIGIFTDPDYAQYQVSNFKGGTLKTFIHLDLAKDYILSYNPAIDIKDIIVYYVWDFYAVTTMNESGIFIKPKELKKYTDSICDENTITIKSFKKFIEAKNFILENNKYIKECDIKIYDKSKRGDKISKLEFYNVFISKETGQPFKFYNSLTKIKVNNSKYFVENFKSKEDALIFLKQFNGDIDIIDFVRKLEYERFMFKKDRVELELEENVIYAFTDGSFNDNRKLIGFSVVFVKNKEIILQSSENDYYYYDDNRGSNVAEFKASLMAIEKAIENNFNSICICHDFDCVDINRREQNYLYAKEYKDFISKYSELIDFNFKKVKAHSGIKWNTLADNLAKREALVIA